MKAFAELNTQEIDAKISGAHKDRKEDYNANKTMFEGDHWRGGQGWAGPLPENGTEKQRAIKKIAELFVSQNVVKEIMERHADGVLSRDPEWSFSPTREMSESDKANEKEEKLISEVEAGLTSWWKKKGVQDILYEFCEHLQMGSRALLRIYIPKSGLQNGRISEQSFLDQLEKIRVELVTPDKGVVIEHEETGRLGGMVKYKRTTEAQNDEDVYELSYLDESGQTVIEVKGNENKYTGNLGGRITIYEGRRNLFVTRQIRRKNDVVNKAHTMLNGNLDSGFLERVFLNAQPPGKWEQDEDGNEKFIPAPIQVGSGTTNFIAGIEYDQSEDETGERKKAITTPSVIFREPVSAETFISSKRHAYEAILEEAKQKHALISGDATPSGESRVQALADFMNSITTTKAQIDEAGTWLIETVTALAMDMAGRDSEVELIRSDFNTRLNPGSIPASLRAEILDQYQDGLLSRESAMAMLGVDDVDAEIAKIDTATMHVKEMLDIIERFGVKPPTLIRELYRVMIQDKEILSELEEAKIKEIEGQIDDILNQQGQERDFFSSAGVDN